MACIGLYDIDFNHGIGFSISLPLMKVYNYFYNQGHQVIMMKPYEKTGRYNKIFYFKDKPNLPVPAKLTISPSKGQCLGYGFYKSSGLKSQEVIDSPPCFTPYELCSGKVKNKILFKRIVNNGIIDWREKDFTGVKNGTTTVYVNDRDFLLEDDWEDLFNHFDKNIDFVHAIRPIKIDGVADMTQIDKFIEMPYGSDTRIFIPPRLGKDEYDHYNQYRGVVYDVEGLSEEELFLPIFISKLTANTKCHFAALKTTPLSKQIIQWGNSSEKISFKNFVGNDWKYDTLKFKYRLLLMQNPNTITYEDIEKEYLIK